MTEEAALIAAEHERRAALMRDDVDAIEAMTAEVFHYAHINGMVEDRSAYLARLRSREVHMPETSARDLRVRFRPGYALLDGVSYIRFERASGVKGEVETLFLSVWEKQDGRWRIVAYASTPLPAVA